MSPDADRRHLARRRILSVALALCGLACDRESGRRGDQTGDRDATGAPLRSGATGQPAEMPNDGASGMSATVPASLGAACFEGDQAGGTPWRLVGEDSAWDRLPSVAIEDLATRDSAGLAARITAVADAIPSDTTGGDFGALPVVVQAAWRVPVGAADTILVARTVRRLPIESAPLEETTLIVAAPAVRVGTRATLALLWSSREVGAEEKADPLDLAVALDSGNAPQLLFVRSAGDPPRAELLTRRDDIWTTAWRGSLPRCARP